MHVEDTAFRVLQLQPAWGQSRCVVAEQRSCAAQAAGRALYMGGRRLLSANTQHFRMKSMESDHASALLEISG